MAKNAKIEYKIGTMIEIPRAALTADEIAKHAEFFSFGTNDLTQMTYGFSRDDVNNHYLSATNTLSVVCSRIISSAAACAAARRAINTRYGEHETYVKPFL